MLCKTIQHKNVLTQLHKNGKYTVDGYDYIANHLIYPYAIMKKHYGYKHMPIFLAPVGYFVNFAGASTDNTSCILTLDVPDRYIKVQDYYMWSDLIYFSELLGQLHSVYNVKDLKEFSKQVLDEYKDGIIKDRTTYQVTTQFLLKSWIRKVEEITPEFIDMYVNTGGVNVLK